ncbi:MAG: peptide deformylase, partial [Candidatus Pacearchaeota archaeon]|nr:peptide deformylase [Candidatus Pacearchaeota archaeon]
GLAGPQANQDAKIIIVHTPEGDHTFVNPQIIQKSRETAEEEEGCLSLPGLFVNVKRAEEVEVACQTLEGETVKLKVSGLTSRIFQHEIDHVEGRLIIHRTPFLKRMRLRKKLREIANLS